MLVIPIYVLDVLYKIMYTPVVLTYMLMSYGVSSDHGPCLLQYHHTHSKHLAKTDRDYLPEDSQSNRERFDTQKRLGCVAMRVRSELAATIVTSK